MRNLRIFGLEFEKTVVIFEIGTLKFVWLQILRKNKMSKFETKNVWFGYIWAGILENYCHIWKQHLRIYLIENFFGETKMLKFGTENALFKDFWPKLAYLDIFGLEFFKKTYCHIWNKHPCLIAKYREIMKTPKFATKIALFGYFWARSLEKLLSYLKSAPSKLFICKITRKTKISKFGTKKALFGYLWARISKKLLSYLKSAPSN